MTDPWSFACPDWFERLQAGRSLVPDLPLDAKEAERAVRIFNKMRIPDVAGLPTMAEAAGEWFRDIIRAAFGSLEAPPRSDPDAACRRRVAEIFTLVPKKNSKTTGGAAVALTAMIMNKRPRAEFLFIGPTQEVAELAFDQATGMIEADRYLSKRFEVIGHKKAIHDRTNKSRLKIKTFDMRTVVGSKAVFVLVDELQILSRVSYATSVIGQIRGGLLPNPESLLIFIATQSDLVPAGVFKAELQYARGVRDGRITKDVRMLPVLYEFPEDMQTDRAKPWADPRNWPMVLPNLGRSIHLTDLVADWSAAQEKGEAEQRRWASQHLNIEVGLALHADRWRGADYWESAADTSLTLDKIIERSEVITVGIDGGGLDDLLGLAILGRCARTNKWLLWTRAWVQDDVLRLRKDIAETLRDFEKDGDLVICDEPGTRDVQEVAELIKRIFDADLIPPKHGIGLDAQGVAAIIDELKARGIETEANGGPVNSIPQGYRLSGAVWGMERKLKDGTLSHSGNPMMAWCVGNATTKLQGNAVVITKEVSGKAKIDPLCAAFDAFSLMSRAPAGQGGLVIPAGYSMHA